MRIGFWTGWLDPQMVAVSKEVHQLMQHFNDSYAFGLSTHYLLKLSPAKRSFGFHSRFYPLLRPMMRVLERQLDVNHVYTSLADWHFLNVLGRRPIVLTVTQRGCPDSSTLLQKVSHVVAETARLAETAVGCGVERSRVSVIHPGVDLDLFQPTPPPSGPWKCLFASSPETTAEIHTKGVDLLLELARLEPELEITVAWRPFSAASTEALSRVRQQGLSNLKVIHGRIPDMHRLYQQFHFTIAPFRTVGKPCPNSILESLAAARPVLVSDFVDIGDIIEEEQAGCVFTQSVESLQDAYRRLKAAYEPMVVNARRCAERHFDILKTCQAYERVYQALSG